MIDATTNPEPRSLKVFSFNKYIYFFFRFVIPNLMNIAFIAAAIWMLVAMVIAVRQALEYKSTLRAVGVVVTGFLIQSVVLFMMLKLF